MTLRRETGPLLRNPIQYRRDRDSFAHALEIAKPFGVLESVLDWCKDELIEEWRWQLLSASTDTRPGRYCFFFDSERDCLAFTLKWS